MPKYLNTPVIRLIIVALWIVLIPLTVIWIITGGGPEAWVFLISGLAIPLAIWIQSRVTHSYDLSEMKDKSHQYLVSLRERLQKEPGIRNFVSLNIQKNPDQAQIKTITDAYDQLNRFVILGKAGTGKTTLLRWLALQAVSKSLDNGELLQTVVWLNLSEWADTETLETFVRRQWLKTDKPLEVIGEQNSIVFLDGLDELGPKSHKKIQQLNNWLQSSFQVVATCRTENFASLNLNLQTVELAPELNDIQICKFVNTYLREDAEQFLALIMLDTPECYEIPEDYGFISDPAYLNRLHELLDAHFDQEELRTLCFDLGVDFDNLRGEGKVSKARELVLLMNRDGRFSELKREISSAKPYVPLPDSTHLQNSKDLSERRQYIANQYLDGKNLRLLIQIITETQERYAHGWTHFENIYQPYIKTPLQIVVLFQHYQKYIEQGNLPLNMGRITDEIIRAICVREQERRASSWVTYPALTTILSEFAYSILSYTYEEDCQTGEGRLLSQASYTLNRSFDQVRYNQQNRYKKALTVGSKWLFLPIWLPVVVLIGLLKLIGDFVLRPLIYNFRLFRPIANIFSDYMDYKRRKSLNAALQQAQPLINLLKSAGILRIVEEYSPYGGTPSKCIHFSNRFYLDYFAAHAFMGNESRPIFGGRRYQVGWRRITGYWDRVFIALSGLVENPKDLVSELAAIHKDSKKGTYEYDNTKPSDHYLAAKCILTLGPDSFDTAFLNTLVNCLVKTMQNVRNAGEDRSVDYARAVYFLGDFGDTSQVTATIERLQPYNFHQEALKEIIVLFGKHHSHQKVIVELLLDELGKRTREKDVEFSSIKTSQFIVRALGEIGNQSALRSLQDLKAKTDPDRETLYGPLLTALIRLGDKEAENEFLKYLIPNDDIVYSEYLRRWLKAADLEIDIIPKLVNILYQYDNPSQPFIRTMAEFGQRAVSPLIQLLRQSKDNPDSAPILPYVQATLIDALAQLGDERVLKTIQTFLIEPNSINIAIAVPNLVNSLAQSVNDHALEITNNYLMKLDLISNSAALDALIDSISDIHDPEIREIIENYHLNSFTHSQNVADFINKLLATDNSPARESNHTFLSQVNLDSDPDALDQYIDALSDLKDPKVIESIQLYYSMTASVSCKAAINAVGLFPNDFDVTLLFPLLINKSPILRSLAAATLGKLGDERAVRPLVRLLEDDTEAHRLFGYGNAEAVCEFAADALLALNTPESIANAFDWYKNRLLNAPRKNSREAHHAQFGLQNIATNEAWQVLNQWESGH